jgi:excisionase family DNA binding protein
VTHAQQHSAPAATPPPIDTAPALATIAEAARYLRLGKSTVYGLVESGELASFKFGRSRRIAWADVRQFVERCRTKSA